MPVSGYASRLCSLAHRVSFRPYSPTSASSVRMPTKVCSYRACLWSRSCHSVYHHRALGFSPPRWGWIPTLQKLLVAEKEPKERTVSMRPIHSTSAPSSASERSPRPTGIDKVRLGLEQYLITNEQMLGRLRHCERIPYSFTRLYRSSPSADESLRRDIFWWNSAITSSFRNGQVGDACRYFQQMPFKNVVTWNCMITGYVHNRRIAEAQIIFDSMPTKNVVSWAALMTGYTKCGRTDDARNVFDRIPDKNVVCWNSMISGYVGNGRIQQARELFDLMPVRNCASWSVMISAYLRCRRLAEARSLFDRAPSRSTSLCNALLSGYVELGCVKEAEDLFSQMGQRDVISWNSMITCYSRAGRMECARKLFDDMPEKDTISWTSIIRGYLQNLNIEAARKLFYEMPNRDIIAWNTMMGGLVRNNMLEDALALFFDMPERDVVSWNTILQGYVRGNDMASARRWFEEMPQRSETSWNTLISGCRSEEALALFRTMVREGFKPDQGTLAVVISVCASLVALGWGKMVHLYVVTTGYEQDTLVMSSLISMYSRCAFRNDSALVFEIMERRDTITWNAMIATYAYHGSAVQALKLYGTMIEQGFRPDNVTFLNLLLACSHKGVISEGCQLFVSMQKDWQLVPKPEHYSCIVDLLGRSGLVSQAYRFTNSMPVELQSNAWETLLSASRYHGDLDVGEVAARRVLHARPSDGGMYILLSNIYAAKEMWEDAASVRALMRARGIKKETGCSWIEVKGKMSSFASNDTCHPLVEAICGELDGLSMIMEQGSC